MTLDQIEDKSVQLKTPSIITSAYGSHALRGNPVRDAPASRTAERFRLHSHAERGNDQFIIAGHTLKGRLCKNSLCNTPNPTAGRRQVTIRTFLAFGAMSLVVGLSGCMIVDSPIKGVLGTEVIWGDIATGKTGSATPASKEGKACAESILGLLARGDASVRAAKENGKITEVTSVDHSARNFLNIVGEWCTIVKGH